MNDLTELAALNRQIASLQAEKEDLLHTLARLLPYVMWFHDTHPQDCALCHAPVLYELDHLTCHHAADCAFRHGQDLTNEAVGRG